MLVNLCGLLAFFLLFLVNSLHGQCNAPPNTSCPPRKTINPDDDNPLLVVTTITKTIVNVVQNVNSLTVNAPTTTSTSTIWITSLYTSTELALSTTTTTTTLILSSTLTSTLTKIFINDSVTTVVTEGTTTVGTVTSSSFKSFSYVFTSYVITTLFRKATNVIRITAYSEETTTVYSYRRFFTTRTVVVPVGTTIYTTVQDTAFFTTITAYVNTGATIQLSATSTTIRTNFRILKTTTISTVTNVFYQAAVTTTVITQPFLYSLLFEGTFTAQSATRTVLIN